MRFLALACVGFCSVPLWTAGGLPDADGAPRARRGQIAFSGISTGLGNSACGGHLDTNLFTVQPNGVGLTQVTEGPDIDGGPAWSPDGKALAFWRGMPSAGPHHFTATDIWLLESSSSAENLTRTPNSFEFSPDWSPDGDQIALDSDRETGPEPSLARGRGFSFDIYVMNRDGTGIRNLLKGPGDQVDPTWSPDGKWIAYADHRTNAIGLVDWRGRRSRTVGLPGSSPPSDPDWSPDGSQIAFAMSGDIWITNLRKEVMSLPVDGNQSGPSWSPDGKSIVFLSSQPGSSSSNRLYTMDSDGGNVRRVIDLDVACGSFLSPPSWGSP